MQQPDFRVRVTAEASVAPSEDPSKVKAAVSNVLGECQVSISEDPRKIVMTSSESASLVKLHDQLRDRHVRAAARRLLITRREGDRVTVMFNRQAAHAGVLVLCGSEGESPLGPIYLSVDSESLDEVIEWLTSYESG